MKNNPKAGYGITKNMAGKAKKKEVLREKNLMVSKKALKRDKARKNPPKPKRIGL